MPPSLEAKLATRDFPPVARRCLEATRSLFLRVAFFFEIALWERGPRSECQMVAHEARF